jgi:hypothetical protein
VYVFWYTAIPQGTRGGVFLESRKPWSYFMTLQPINQWLLTKKGSRSRVANTFTYLDFESVFGEVLADANCQSPLTSGKRGTTQTRGAPWWPCYPAFRCLGPDQTTKNSTGVPSKPHASFDRLKGSSLPQRMSSPQ